MAHLNKKCLCDGTRYSYCPDCSRADALAPSWKSEFCSETCMTLWMTLTRFGMNRLTKSEAKSIIEGLDLKPIDSYVDCVKRDYAKVMTEEKKPKRGKRIEIKPIDEPINMEKTVVKEIIATVEQAVETSHEVVKQENE